MSNQKEDFDAPPDPCFYGAGSYSQASSAAKLSLEVWWYSFSDRNLLAEVSWQSVESVWDYLAGNGRHDVQVKPC